MLHALRRAANALHGEVTRTLAGCETFATLHSGGDGGGGGGGGGGEQLGTVQRTARASSADLARLRREVASLQAESDEQLSIVHGLVAAGQS